MPIYEYECNECGEAFEKRMSFADADVAPECPNCASENTHKKISRVGALGGAFSGSGVTSSSSCGSHGGFG